MGLNGDKDFLPHHRIGGTDLGGDCYPGGNRLRYWSELILDEANRNKGNWKYKFYTRISSFIMAVIISRKKFTIQLPVGMVMILPGEW